MEFSKLHGLGNDFLAVDVRDRKGTRPLSELARLFCSRHCGVGADGILFYQPTSGDPDADFSVLIFNADGSKAEMSGNGVRCLAASVVHSGEHRSHTPRIRTVSGIKKLRLKGRQGFKYEFECSMGHPITDPARIPTNLGNSPGPILDAAINLDIGTISAALSSMGNPHCSTFWPDLAQVPIEKFGPRIENHPGFPNRTNVEFIQILDRHRIRVKFWERGVGLTLASGTGSSAAAVASILKGLAENPVTVETELGSLLVEWKPEKELSLTGPAEFICTGDFPAAEG